MLRLFPWTAIAGCAALVAAPLVARQQPIFHAGVDLVAVDVSVRAKNTPVQGLAAPDFEVLDNGVAQQIQDITYETQPIDVTIALDVSQSVGGRTLDDLRKAVQELMGDLSAADRLRLFTVNERIARVIDFTSDAKSVITAIKATSGSGGTSIFDAMSVALVTANDLDRRQLLVVFSDGRDSTSVSDRDSVLDVARRSRAATALVLTAPYVTGDLKAFYLDLANETGGTVVPILPGTDVSKTFRSLLSDFRSSYVLRFTPHGVEHRGYHTLTVKVRRPGALDVRARRGYFGG